MKKTGRPDARSREMQLREIEDRLAEQLQNLIGMVDDRVHPNRMDAEFAYARSLLSSRNTIYHEREREEKRHALA